jgi:hypothetical protein
MKTIFPRSQTSFNRSAFAPQSELIDLKLESSNEVST